MLNKSWSSMHGTNQYITTVSHKTEITWNVHETECDETVYMEQRYMELGMHGAVCIEQITCSRIVKQKQHAT
jgi:hypothetical protein